ncbi:hypothetical protein [Listeria monocytogenes]|nr:hypothetical protein [Listeria monocytogenes]
MYKKKTTEEVIDLLNTDQEDAKETVDVSTSTNETGKSYIAVKT